MNDETSLDVEAVPDPEIVVSITADDHPVVPAEDHRVRRVEILISRILRTGVLASLAIVVFGTVVTFVQDPNVLHSARGLHDLTSPAAPFPHSLASVIHEAIAFRGRAIVMAGLLLLIATPVMRVAVSIATFVYQRDRTFVVITSVVLALLLLSFALGRVGG